MASRSRTQRKNKNKRKSQSRRYRKYRGGAASMSCNEAATINANPSNYGIVQRMAAKLQKTSCSSGMKSVAPNRKWATPGSAIRPNSPTTRCNKENPDGTCAEVQKSKEFNMF